MGLQINKEFVATLTPLMPTLETLPTARVHDIRARRELLASFVGKMGVHPGVFQIIHHVKTPHGYLLPIWHLSAKKTEQSSAKEPAVVHMHGGGFISLSPAVMVTWLSEYVLKTGAQLFCVDYRLAPEYPYPTPLDDFWVALNLVIAQAEQFGIDASRIGVMGGGAGGGLPAGLTLLARHRRLQPPIARQTLGCSILDDRKKESLPQGVATLWKAEDNVAR